MKRTAIAIALLCSGLAYAQTSAPVSEAKNHVTPDKTSNPTSSQLQADKCDKQLTPPLERLTITKRCLQPLELSPGARIARAFQYQLGLVEQSSVPGATKGMFLQAPEHYLIQHSLTFDFSEVFLKSSDLTPILKSYYENVVFPTGKLKAAKNSPKVSLDDLCPNSSALECLASSGAWWKRALLGVKGTFSLAEHQRAIGGIVVPEQPFPGDYDRTGQITFDPTSLFINGSNWSGAMSVLAEMNLDESAQDINKREKTLEQWYKTCFGYDGGPIQADAKYATHRLVDSRRMSDCIAHFGGSKRGGIGFLAAAIPTFTFKRASQFNFISNAGIIVPTPFGEPAINTYTFSWDLKRLIAPRSARLPLIDAMTQPAKVAKAQEADTAEQNKNNTKPTKLCITISSQGQTSFLSVPDSFSDNACREFAGNLDSMGQYELGCVLANSVSIGRAAGISANAQYPPQNTCHWGPQVLTATAD